MKTDSNIVKRDNSGKSQQNNNRIESNKSDSGTKKIMYISEELVAIFILLYFFTLFFIWHLVETKSKNEQKMSVMKMELDSLRIKIKELEEQQKVWQIIEESGSSLNQTEKKTLTQVVINESKRFNFDPFLLLAIIQTESSFRTQIVSHKGAVGLMQVMPGTAKYLAKKTGIFTVTDSTLYKPDENVRIGSLYLAYLLIKFKDVKKAIAAYNMGPTNLVRNLRKNRVPERYFKRVLKNYKEFKNYSTNKS